MQAGRINEVEVTGLGGKEAEDLSRSELERYRCIQRVNAGPCDYGEARWGRRWPQEQACEAGEAPWRRGQGTKRPRRWVTHSSGSHILAVSEATEGLLKLRLLGSTR